MIIGVDPGSNGGLAFLGSSTRVVKMPEDDEAVLEALRPKGHDPLKSWVYIEQIPKWCGHQRFASQTVRGSSLAVLYGNFKFVHGAALAFGYNVKLITPQRWQSLVECTNAERLDKGDWKRKLKARAAELFPDQKVTLYAADALLIARAGEIWRAQNFRK